MSFYCTVCDKPRDRDANHWFSMVVRCDRKEQPVLEVKLWNLMDAQQAESQGVTPGYVQTKASVCGQSHVLILTERFLTTGRFNRAV